MGEGVTSKVNNCKDNEHLNYKLKNYNNLDMVSKLKVVRDIKGSVIDLVYYNLLRGMKSSFKSDCLRRGKDKVDSLTYSIIVGDYMLSIPLYNLNILRLHYVDNVEPSCMPISVVPLKDSIYSELELYERIIEGGVKLKDFMGVYAGGKLNGLCIYIFNKRKAMDYLDTKIKRLKKVISDHTDNMEIYNNKYIAYNNRIDANISFLASISEDLTYLQSNGFSVDIML